MMLELAEQINKDKFVPDYIIGISRGGYFPVAFINKMLHKWAKITFADIERDELDPNKRTIRELGICEGVDIKGKKILLCDDTNETGLTFIALKQYLEQRGAIVKILCYFSRPASQIVPDYVVDPEIDFEPQYPWGNLGNLISS